MDYINLIPSLVFLYLLYYVFLKGKNRPTKIEIFNQTNNIFLSKNAVGAYTLFRRMTGLLNHATIADDCALHIESAKKIHMNGMRFPIDIIFLDKDLNVIKIEEFVAPSETKTYNGGTSCKSAIEIKAGLVKKTGTKIGDKIVIAAII